MLFRSNCSTPIEYKYVHGTRGVCSAVISTSDYEQATCNSTHVISMRYSDSACKNFKGKKETGKKNSKH